MAGGFTLQIDDQMARRLEEGAKAAGLSREDYATFLLLQHTARLDDYEWVGEAPRIAAALEVSEEGARDWDEFEAEVRKDMADRSREHR